MNSCPFNLTFVQGLLEGEIVCVCVCVCTNNRKQYSEHGHRELHFARWRPWVPADRVTAAAAGPAHKLRRLLPVSRLKKTLLSQGGDSGLRLSPGFSPAP